MMYPSCLVAGIEAHKARRRPPVAVVPWERVRPVLASPEPLAAPLAAKSAPRFVKLPPSQPPLPRLIPEAVAKKATPLIALIVAALPVTREELLGPTRVPRVVHARAILFFLLKRFGSAYMSLPNIGRQCGNRDHTTVLHGLRKVAVIVASAGEPEEDTPGAWLVHLWAQPWPTLKKAALPH